MKRIFAVLLMIALSVLMLAGCGCEHEWKDATCDAPKTCAKCDATEGAPAGHSWLAATCEAPKTCENCNTTEGEALPHDWLEATCEEPKTCAECDTTEGEALGHTWVDATYDAPKTCSVCEATDGDPLTLTDLGMTVEELETGLSTVIAMMDYELSYWGIEESTGWLVYEINVASTGAYTNADLYVIPSESNNVYGLMLYTESVEDYDAGVAIGAVGMLSLIGINENFDVDAFNAMLQGQPEVIDGISTYSMTDAGLEVLMEEAEDYAALYIFPAE